MASSSDRIDEFDFDTATPYDMAVLLESIFNDFDHHGRSGGQLLLAQSVLDRYRASVVKTSHPTVVNALKDHLIKVWTAADTLQSTADEMRRFANGEK